MPRVASRQRGENVRRNDPAAAAAGGLAHPTLLRRVANLHEFEALDRLGKSEIPGHLAAQGLDMRLAATGERDP